MARAWILTIVSAALYAACFPPLALGPLAWVALVPLLVAVGRATPAKAAGLGFVWAVLATYGVAPWLPAMIAGYFEQPRWIGWSAFTAVAIGMIGIYFAAFTTWVARMARRGRAGPLLVAAAWGVWEFARSRAWIGDPWALLAYSQAGWPTVLQVADVGGPYAIGVLIAAVNAAVAAMLEPTLRGRRYLGSVAVVAGAGILTIAYGHACLGREFGTGDPIRTAVVQANVERGFRWQPEYQRLGLREHLELTHRVASSRPGLVVWPEYAISFYLDEPRAERAELLAGVRDLGGDLLLGGPHYAFLPTGRTVYHNSVYLVRDGEVRDRYDKMHLLPVAEEALLASRPVRGGTPYTSGTEPRVFTTPTARIGAFVCFEAMYPEIVRAFVAGGATVLANLSNDAWFASEAAARLHLSIASLRAVEARRYLVRATPTGYSAIVDPHGHAIAAAPFGAPAVIEATIRPSVASPLYQDWGDLGAWLCLAAVVIASLRTARA